PDRLIEVVVRPEVLQRDRGQRPVAVERPAGGQPQDEEADRNGDQRDRDSRKHPPDGVTEHQLRTFFCARGQAPTRRAASAGDRAASRPGPAARSTDYSVLLSHRVRWMSFGLSTKPWM